MITQFTKSKFDKIIEDELNESNFLGNKNGMIKLKILFSKGQKLCITHIGTKSIELSEIQIDKIKKIIQEIKEFTLGKQKNTEVDCLGILYIDISNGKITKTRNINFEFFKKLHSQCIRGTS